jgi:hypothetical protein
MTYRRLDAEQTVATVALLLQRIRERFPGSGLVHVCEELLALARESTATAERIARPLVTLRVAVGLVLLGIATLLVFTIAGLDLDLETNSAADLVQVFESTLNAIALMGAAIFFLVTIENRVKRTRALAALHELRSMAHVIDMHQLTKDPRIPGVAVVTTPSSPDRPLDDFQLTRYLDYCSEMLALLGKIAALYAQSSADREIASVVNEVEILTGGLIRQIWDKIQSIYVSHRPE